MKQFQIFKLIIFLFFKFFVFNPSLSYASEDNQPEIFRDELDKLKIITQEALKKLNSKKSFINYDLNLTSSEIETLEKIKINYIYKDYNNYGNLENLEKEIISFITSLGNSEEISRKSALLISRIVKETIQACKQETAWITIRAFTGTNEFDTPRWHVDGYYYQPFDGEQYKIVMSLKGASTLFYNLPEEQRKEFYLLLNNQNRNALARLLDRSKAQSANFGQATIYIVGAEHAAVHSEPPIHHERIFLSILSGSKIQIQELYERWNKLNE